MRSPPTTIVDLMQRLKESMVQTTQVIGQCRATQHYIPRRSDDEDALQQRIVELAREYVRYGYLRITALLRQEGWRVNHKRVERIWRQEGLKVLRKHSKRAQLWLTDSSCVRRRPAHPHHVWAYDFVMDRTHDGRPVKMLTVVDEYARECLAIAVRCRMKSTDVRKRCWVNCSSPMVVPCIFDRTTVPSSSPSHFGSG